MSLSYRDIHWGTSPDKATQMQFVSNCDCVPVGEIVAVSYVTVKGKPGIWRHEFSKHRDADGTTRGPLLLSADRAANPGGKTIHVNGGAPTMNAIGTCIDFEMAGGSRVFVCDCVLATDPEGNHVWLCSTNQVPFAIEQREKGPFVTAHGIEQ